MVNLENPETPANRHRDGCEALSFFYFFSFFILPIKLRSKSIFLHHFAHLTRLWACRKSLDVDLGRFRNFENFKRFDHLC